MQIFQNKALRGFCIPHGIIATIIFTEIEKYQRLDKKSRGSQTGTREGSTAKQTPKYSSF
jgi:hypothetical protein